VRGGPLDLTRLAVEAAFLLLVAVGVGFAGLGAVWIVLVVAAAWALVALFEWQLHRRRPPPPLSGGRLAEVSSLLASPAPAVLTTYRQDGSALVTPVWFRWHGGAFEVVIAQGDVKLRHLARDPRCTLVVFEAVRPFRGIEVRGRPELVEGDVTEARAAIAGRYLGARDGRRFAEARRSKPGVLLRLVPDEPRVWDLSAILPRRDRTGAARA
jgi:PPOX class probable F420-dependent enzyme